LTKDSNVAVGADSIVNVHMVGDVADELPRSRMWRQRGGGNGVVQVGRWVSRTGGTADDPVAERGAGAHAISFRMIKNSMVSGRLGTVLTRERA
jgi:hypothetical protein